MAGAPAGMGDDIADCPIRVGGGIGQRQGRVVVVISIDSYLRVWQWRYTEKMLTRQSDAENRDDASQQTNALPIISRIRCCCCCVHKLSWRS